jgi:hypothetical protein
MNHGMYLLGYNYRLLIIKNNITSHSSFVNQTTIYNDDSGYLLPAHMIKEIYNKGL